ncbi:MAG: sulfotransferase family protein [Candidatus Limnocylindrales bacterium]
MPLGGRLGGLRGSLGGKPAAGSSRVVTVVGMHRSGTSSLVGSLEAAGLPLGEVRREGGDSNEKGHREPGEVIRLHDDVLMNSRGAWHLPPASVTWSQEQRDRRDAFIATHAGMPLWGWKEPRTLLVIDGWLEVLPHLEMVGTFRHPLVVARSLKRRHGNDTPRMWLEVWLAYNEILLHLVEQRHIPLIDFDLPAAEYATRLRAIADELHLPGGDDDFFDATLRTSQKQAPQDADLPAEVARVYRELKRSAASQAAR